MKQRPLENSKDLAVVKIGEKYLFSETETDELSNKDSETFPVEEELSPVE